MANIGALCVYCGSSSRGPASHVQAAERLGAAMAARGIGLVYGGGRVGLMGRIADAVMAAGGEVVGVIPAFLESHEIGHSDITRLEVVASMHARKARMAELSDAFVVLPGGFGTLDEMFEILTWRQLGLHDKPLVLADIDGYWRPLIALFEGIVAQGYARDAHMGLLHVVERIDAVLPALDAIQPAKTHVEAKWL